MSTQDPVKVKCDAMAIIERDMFDAFRRREDAVALALRDTLERVDCYVKVKPIDAEGGAS